MKKLILLTTVFFIFFSCKKAYEPFEIPCTLTQDSSLAKKYIKGTWEWLEEKSVSHASGKTIYETPKTRGYNVKMIVADSTLIWIENSVTINYKYKIQLKGEITGTTFPQDILTSLVLYDITNGKRQYYVPIKICNEYLQEQRNYVTSYGGLSTWRKL
jgi:hypothetical protein